MRERQMYEAGMSSYEIAEAVGVNRVSVLRRLRKQGATIRSIAPRSPRDLARRALGKQRCARPSHYEAAFIRALRARGEDPVAHYAVDKYNIDVALPTRMLAYEIDGGNWHNAPGKRRQDAAKIAALTPRGWAVVHVRTQRPGWIEKALNGTLSISPAPRT